MEGVRQGDELLAVEQNLPPLSSRLQLARPLPGLLRDLLPDELDICQLVHEHSLFIDVLDHFPGSDLDACQHIYNLMHRKFVLSDTPVPARPDADIPTPLA